MSEIMSGDSLICISAKDAIREILGLAFLGKKNPNYAIERLTTVIACAEYEIKLLKKETEKEFLSNLDKGK